MNRHIFKSRVLVGCSVVLAPLLAGKAYTTEPCGDFGECKTLVEINASDGDIGFHFLMDGDNLLEASIIDPSDVEIFHDEAFGPLADQTLTETFAESSEPLCWDDPEADEDELIVTLEEFLDRWTPGTYTFEGLDNEGEEAEGATELSFDLPAAPAEVDYDDGVVSWEAGDDLGRCADADELDDLVADGVLPTHPEDVPVAAWEIVVEPDVESDHPANGLVFSIRVPGDVEEMELEIPEAYLDSLGDDTPIKVEVGAIGGDDNATFTEEDGFCAGDECEEEEEDDDDEGDDEEEEFEKCFVSYFTAPCKDEEDD